MEIRSVPDRIRYYSRQPSRFVSDVRGNLKRIARLGCSLRRMQNLLRSKLRKPSEVIGHGPRHAVLFVTDQCNIECRWCLRNRPESSEMQHALLPDMTLEVFKRILDKLPGLEAVSFTGQGEPLLNPALFDMLEHARERKITCFLTTNGISLDADVSERLMNLGLFRINISLKGKDPGEFSEVTSRPEGVFARMQENIRACVALKQRLKSDLIIRLSYVVDRANLGAMDDVITLAESLGVDRVIFDNLVPFHDFEQGEGTLFEDDADARQIVEALERRASPVLVDLPILIRKRHFTYFCPGYYEFINVDTLGNVSGCSRNLSPDASYGNVFNDADWMNGQHFRETRRMFLNRDMPDRCRFCVEMSRS